MVSRVNVRFGDPPPLKDYYTQGRPRGSAVIAMASQSPAGRKICVMLQGDMALRLP
jgi:hypothetical protein